MFPAVLDLDHGVCKSSFELSSHLGCQVSRCYVRSMIWTYFASLATSRAYTLGAWSLVVGSVDSLQYSLVSGRTVGRVEVRRCGIFWSTDLTTRLRRVTLVLLLWNNRYTWTTLLVRYGIGTQVGLFALRRPLVLS
ncbi:hypothetical protein E4T44_04301 [Aureobasidium sp. EXF-8845]|nr:hypothetical protein E4T45_06706 [Aureobasidium sp. EXF-8846]KAI4847811.1 hypothetical protein E4T44_04301 [Aureobasidium sp. EXF-8845]